MEPTHAVKVGPAWVDITRATESGDLGHRAVEELVDERVGVCSASGQVGVGVGQAQLVGGLPGDGDLAGGVAGGQGCVQACGRRGGESVGASQDAADLIERVAFVAALVQGNGSSAATVTCSRHCCGWAASQSP